MRFDAEEFDAQHFDVESATEDQCWAAIPHLMGSQKADTLNHLGGLAFERNDFSKASMLADQAAFEWQKLGHDLDAAKCYSNAGSCLRHAGEFEQALTFYMKAADISIDAREDAFYATTTHIIGQIHNELFNREEALKYFEITMHTAEDLDDTLLLTHAYEGVGVAYLSLGQPELAIDFLRKGLELSSGEGNIRHAVVFRPLIAACHKMMGRPELGIDELNAAREFSTLMNEATGICEFGNQLSQLHREDGNFELAIEIAESVKQRAIKEHFPKQATNANANIGHALIALGQYESAYQLLTTAAEVMKMGGDFAQAVLAEAAAAHAALEMGNVPLAQLRLSGCDDSAKKINLRECNREHDLNNPHSMLSLVKLRLSLEIQLLSGAASTFSLLNPSMNELFEIENKAVYLENQSIVNDLVSLKPEFIVAGGIPELTSPEGELLTKTLAELIDEKFFVDDPSKLARFHELQALVRKDTREALENLTLAVTYYLDAENIEKASELSRRLQIELANRSEISRARAINSRIY